MSHAIQPFRASIEPKPGSPPTIDCSGPLAILGRRDEGLPAERSWWCRLPDLEEEEIHQQASGQVKCTPCNADAGDPGAFIDRSVPEGDPNQ
jgi:hypothetical protein